MSALTRLFVRKTISDWMLSIPWNKPSKVRRFLGYALDVSRCRPFRPREGQGSASSITSLSFPSAEEAEGAILCLLLSPAFLGKTSLGKSIAKATGRDNLAWRWAACVTEPRFRRSPAEPYIGSCPARFIPVR